ncbi:MAG: hypothetical protein UH788_07470 [Treponemataceae bacterium]|nr:hypothetical protein [Treponemataceae bacterium]
MKNEEKEIIENNEKSTSAKKSSAKKQNSKEKKEPKTISAKKLPKIFKKRYLENSYKKKILKKVYVASDKKLIESLFETEKDKKDREVYFVPQDKKIPTKDFKRLKLVAKQIKKQKGGIKFLPLVACLIFVSILVIAISLFKNPLLEKVLVSSLQGVFKAKTDIEKVDFKILGASLEIKGIQQANKDEPMKNLFEIENIKVDYNLTELLKGKFYAQDLTVSGVALGTERSESGEIPFVPKTIEELEAEKEMEVKKAQLKESAKTRLKEMFSAYNPDNFIGNIEEELQTSEISKQVTEEVQQKIDKWQNAPDELENSINNFSESINKVVNTNWSGISNLKELKAALDSTSNAITQGKTVTTSFENTTKDLLADVNKITNYVNLVEDTVKSDIALVDSKINNIKYLFSVEGFSQIMNDGVQSMLYDIFGKYYTYLLKAKDLASSVSEKKDELTESVKEVIPNELTEVASKLEKVNTKEIKPKKQRLKGRDVYYKKDTIPSFLIENVYASGYENGTENLLFEAKIKELSFDHNVREKPTELSASFKIHEHNNKTSLIFDSRSQSLKPVIYGDYFGTGFPIKSDAEVFKIDTISNIDADVSIKKNGVLGLGGILDMDISEIIAMDLENEKVNELYQKALSRVENLTLGFDIEIGLNGEFSVKIANPEELVTQLSKPVASVFEEEISQITANAKEKATAYISKNSEQINAKMAEFNKIKDLVKGKESALDSLNKKLEGKKVELTKRIEELTKQSTTDALKGLGLPATSNDKSSTKSSSDALKDLKKLFN